MKVSVGIVTFERSHTLKLVLDSLEKQKPNEVIIVDSSRNEKTRNLVKDYDVKYIRTDKRIYQPQARNIILRECTYKVIAFLDDDAIPGNKWLENIKKGYSFDVVGVTGPAINVNNELKPIEKILRTDKNQNYFTSYGDIRCEARRWVPSKPIFCSIMLGANMSFLKDKLMDVGGFDEFYSHDAAVREETDPQIALIKRGYKFIYMPGALVYHLKSEIGGIRENPKKDYYYWAGVHHRYLCDKYFPKWKSRLSWIFWSVNPPCIWLAIVLAILKKDFNILKWHKGLWQCVE